MATSTKQTTKKKTQSAKQAKKSKRTKKTTPKGKSVKNKTASQNVANPTAALKAQLDSLVKANHALTQEVGALRQQVGSTSGKPVVIEIGANARKEFKSALDRIRPPADTLPNPPGLSRLREEAPAALRVEFRAALDASGVADLRKAAEASGRKKAEIDAAKTKDDLLELLLAPVPIATQT